LICRFKIARLNNIKYDILYDISYSNFMPHISKQKIKADVVNEIYSSLLEIIASTPESKKKEAAFSRTFD